MTTARDADAGELVWGRLVGAVSLGLGHAAGQLPSELSFELGVRNVARDARSLALATCDHVGWPAFVVLFVRLDGRRTFRFLAGPSLDVASVHPHEPLLLAAQQERRERVALREAALRPLATDGRALGSALLEARRIELWAELHVGALRLRSGRVHRSLALVPAATAAPRVAGAGCYTQLVAGGQAAACALSRSGTPWCWGAHPPGRRFSEGPIAPGPVVPLEGAAVELAMAGASLCARTVAGAVFCTGPASDDQAEALDIGRVWRAPGLPPTALTAVAQDRTQVFAGAQQSCALRHQGELWCRAAPSLPLARVGIDAGVAQVVFGAQDACARTEAGAVWCWHGSAAAAPRRLASGGIETLAASAWLICALSTTGTVWCVDLSHEQPQPRRVALPRACGAR